MISFQCFIEKLLAFVSVNNLSGHDRKDLLEMHSLFKDYDSYQNTPHKAYMEELAKTVPNFDIMQQCREQIMGFGQPHMIEHPKQDHSILDTAAAVAVGAGVGLLAGSLFGGGSDDNSSSDDDDDSDSSSSDDFDGGFSGGGGADDSW